MLNKIIYYIKNKKILSKIIVLNYYILLGILSILLKPFFILFKKNNIYFFQDRPFGIDNAYFLYKYFKQNHPEIKSIYLVKDKNDAKYKKLLEDKDIVYNLSLRHFWYFINSSKIIFSFDTAPFYFFGKIGTLLKRLLKNKTNFIFLGHGTTRVHIPFFNKENNVFDLFVTSSRQEKEFLDKNFGYNKETIVTGLPRFDNLYNNSKREKIIFFFPTWNNKLYGLSKKEFINTDYYKGIISLLESKEISLWLKNNNFKLYYYPHQGIKDYISLFKIKNNNIIILDDNNKNNISISDLILRSSILITNYSSIIFDFAYQLKPVIYFNIGEDHYKNKAPYYYNFGKKCNLIGEIINELENIKQNNFLVSEYFKKEINIFFENIDSNNCKRNSIYINKYN